MNKSINVLKKVLGKKALLNLEPYGENFGYNGEKSGSSFKGDVVLLDARRVTCKDGRELSMFEQQTSKLAIKIPI